MTVNKFTNEFLIIFLGIILLAASIIDLRVQKIPNAITFPATGLALAYHSFVNGFNGFLFSAAGLTAGVGLLFIPYLLGGMGAGDAKLMGVVGGILGIKGVFYAFLCSAMVGGVYAVILTLVYRQRFRGFYKKQLNSLITFLIIRKHIPTPEDSDLKKPRLCYGLAIAIGTGIYIVFDLSGIGFLT